MKELSHSSPVRHITDHAFVLTKRQAYFIRGPAADLAKLERIRLGRPQGTIDVVEEAARALGRLGLGLRIRFGLRQSPVRAFTRWLGLVEETRLSG